MASTGSPNTTQAKIEGILATNPGYDFSTTVPQMPVPQEAVSEYRVNTSGALVDGGVGSGGQVNVFIKSGTNTFHGAAFDFIRNTAFDANDFFNNKTGTPKPLLHRNQFGFALGGPIIRNRTFFFVTSEWQRQKQGSVENRYVYTPTLRSGLFRYYTKGANSGALVDASGNPTVPASDIGSINLLTVDPTRLGFDTVYLPKLLAVMPAPNNYDIGDGLNLAGYRYNSPIPDNYYQFIFKLDHELTSRNHLSFTYGQGQEDTPFPQLISGLYSESFRDIRQGGSLRLTSVITPHITNELSIGANNRSPTRKILIQDQLTPKGNIQWAGISVGTFIAGGTNGNPYSNRGDQINPTVNKGFSDNATWIHGNQTLSFGGELWLETMNRKSGVQYPILSTTNASNPANIPALPGLNSSDRTRAAQLTNDLTGSIGTITQTFYLNSLSGFVPFEQNYEPLRKHEYSWFVQDIWKIRPNLSLNLGVRQDILPPVYMANGVYLYPVGGYQGALGVQGATGQPTQWGIAPNDGKDIFHTDKTSFSPAVGFVWDPFGTGKTAIRASYRIAHDRFPIAAGDFSGSNYGNSTTVSALPFTRFSDPALYGSILPFPTPQAFAPLGNIRTGTAYVVDPNIRNPYVHLWSFGIQREVLKNWVVSATYDGNHAVGEWRGQDLNQVEMRSNGFLDAFRIAQANLSQHGSPVMGQNLGSLQSLFSQVPSSQYNLITQGQAAALANFLDTTTLKTGEKGGLLTLSGLPDTFFRLNPQVASVYAVGNFTHSTWDGLKIRVMHPLDRGLYFDFNYTFSKGFTDSVPNQLYTLSPYRDNANPGLDKALLPYDSTHVFQVNGIWELPVGRGKALANNMPGWMDSVVGGWQLNGLFSFSTGFPLALTTGRYNLSQDTASTPNFSGGFTNLGQVHKGGSQVTFLTPQQASAFTNPGAGEAGGLPLYQFHGPGFSSLDMSLFKKFVLPWHESSLQVRAEFFNVLNHASFQSPSTNINSGSFGVLSADYAARVGQLALKVTF